MSRCQSSTGSLFHSRGPATAKLLLPNRVCVRGTAQVWTSADRRCRRPRSMTNWQSSNRYGGVRPWRDLYTSTAILKSTRCLISSQWSCRSTGVCDVVSPTSASDQPRCRVLHRLQGLNQTVRDATQNCVAVVQAAWDKGLGWVKLLSAAGSAAVLFNGIKEI